MPIALQPEQLGEISQLAYTKHPLPLEEEVTFMTKADDLRLIAVEHSLNWHKGIGWGLAVIYAGIFTWFLTWYLPKELGTARELTKLDTAAELQPINVQLARLTALVELKNNKDVASAIRNNLSFAGAPTLAVATVSAIARQARIDRISTNPQVLVEADSKLRKLAEERPDLKPTTWAARLELASYRTSLNSPGARLPLKNSQPVFTIAGRMFDGNYFSN